MALPSGGAGGQLPPPPPQRFDKVTITLLEVSSLPPSQVIRENILALPPCSKMARYGAAFVSL